MEKDNVSKVKNLESSPVDFSNKENMNPITNFDELHFESIDCKEVMTLKEELQDGSDATKAPSNSKTMSAFLILNSMIGKLIKFRSNDAKCKFSVDLTSQFVRTLLWD